MLSSLRKPKYLILSQMSICTATWKPKVAQKQPERGINAVALEALSINVGMHNGTLHDRQVLPVSAGALPTELSAATCIRHTFQMQSRKFP